MMRPSARTMLIRQMERIIAENCSTKNLMNGKKYRYPVHYNKNGKKYIKKGRGTADVDDKDIKSMKYEFGAHEMNIGVALDEILKFIENECEMDGSLFYFYEDEKDFDPDDYFVM